MYKVNTNTNTCVSNSIALKMLDVYAFSFTNATSGDKCAHMGVINTLQRNVHLSSMEVWHS